MPLNLFKYASIGLAALCLILFAMYSIEKRGAQKWKARADAHHAELQRISSAKDEQKVITRDRIVVAERVVKQADDRAKRIEAAPLPGQCKTPEAIMGADL
jgi:hypothetical protein